MRRLIACLTLGLAPIAGLWAQAPMIYENGVLIGGGTMYNLYGEGSDPADHYIFWDPAAARDVPLALRDRTVVLRGSVLDAAMAALLES